LNVGIIGAGTMGNLHAGCCVEIPDLTVSTVADLELEKAEALASRVGAKATAKAEDVLDDAAIDIVAVCVPTPGHRDLILAAAKAGKNIFAEKPLALTLEQGREILDAVDKAGVRLFIGQVVRYFHEYVKLKEQIDAGAVGRVGVVRLLRGGPAPFGGKAWYNEREKSGTLILDMLIHDIDWLRWCFGDAKRVFAQNIAHHGIKELDYALVCIRFQSGVIAHVTGSWAYPGNFRTEYEVAGSKGLLYGSSDDAAPIRVELHDTDAPGGGVAVPELPTLKTPFRLEWEDFVAWLKDDREPRVSAQDALEAMKIALAALESVDSGEPVEL
jgi:UDP-N-acetylglucosamine 3-dehydrogenase